MSEKEIVRLQKWRLGVLRHVQEVIHNVAKTSGTIVAKQNVAKIIYLRQNYHFGAYRIKVYLKRYHTILS